VTTGARALIARLAHINTTQCSVLVLQWASNEASSMFQETQYGATTAATMKVSWESF
jgi:hypothetical protein